MAGVVLDADAVAQVITYVAPGFIVRMGYRARYPGPDRGAGEVLIIAVVVSLPLVALVTELLPGAQRPTQPGYVIVLLLAAAAIGYATALLRGRRRIKRLLAKIGYRLEPEGTIYAQTLRHMSPEGSVLIELKDGRRVWGCPRSGPQSNSDGIRELYLTYPQSPGEDGEYCPVGAAMIVPISEISNIVLSEDPTAEDAPRGSAAAA